jgi:hypothetical protein
MRWPTPGISTHVHPRSDPKKACAAAGSGVRMLIQQNWPGFRSVVVLMGTPVWRETRNGKRETGNDA